MSIPPASVIGHAVVNLIQKAIDKAVESPPPDEHDLTIIVTEHMPTLNTPIPDDPSIRQALSEQLGRPVDDQRVDDFLEMVWKYDAVTSAHEGDGEDRDAHPK